MKKKQFEHGPNQNQQEFARLDAFWKYLCLFDADCFCRLEKAKSKMYR